VVLNKRIFAKQKKKRMTTFVSQVRTIEGREPNTEANPSLSSGMVKVSTQGRNFGEFENGPNPATYTRPNESLTKRTSALSKNPEINEQTDHTKQQGW
jgi:hypothetical protein